MKTTKRVLSILLAILLGLALLAPMASAAGDPAYAPIITKQPKASVTVLTTKDLVLEVEAKLPDGVQGTLSYEWYRDGRKVDGNGAKLVYRSGGIASHDSRFWAVITNTYIDDEGQEQTASLTSDTCTVSFKSSLGVMLLALFLGPLVAIPMELLHNPFNLIFFPITILSVLGDLARDFVEFFFAATSS